MNLRQLIAALEALEPDATPAFGFTNPHSYRGYYACLAFEPAYLYLFALIYLAGRR